MPFAAVVAACLQSYFFVIVHELHDQEYLHTNLSEISQAVLGRNAHTAQVYFSQLCLEMLDGG